MEPELRRLYHDRIAVIHAGVTAMIRSVAEAIPDATAAILGNDLKLAATVVEGDRALDTTCAETELALVDMIAREAPVGRDLRFVLATLRILQSIERCGDLTASIAKRTGRVDPASLEGDITELIADIGAGSAEMLGAAADAYAVIDEDMASAIVTSDDTIDELEHRLMRALFAGRGPIEPTVDLAFVARFYERIADHAVVIAERVRFIASGEMLTGDLDSN